MASLTPKFSFRKPAGSDAVNVVTDINESMDKIDALYGAKAMVKRVAGSMDVPNGGFPITNVWTQLPAGTFAGRDDLDCTVKAIVGDWLEVGVNGLWDAQACEGYMDCLFKLSATTFAGHTSPLVSATASGQGVVGWRGVASQHVPISGSVMKQVTADDIDGSGNVTTILVARTNSLAIRRKIWAVADIPFFVFLINHGSNV